MSIKRVNGFYTCDFRLSDGRRIVRKLPLAETLKAARGAETALKSSLEADDAPKSKRVWTFQKFVKERFLPKSEDGKSHANNKAVAAMLCAHFKQTPLKEIGVFEIETLQKTRKGIKTRSGAARADSTVNFEMGVLSQIFALAVRYEILKKNPCAGLEQLTGKTKHERVLTLDEQNLLLEELWDNREIADAVTVALNLGLRRSEVWNLQWRDVDFARQKLTVRDRKNGETSVLPLLPILETLFHRRKSAANAERILETSFVFAQTSTNKRQSVTSMYQKYVAAADRAGLAKIRFHDLRHTAATRLASQGVDLFSLTEIFGWKTPAMALRYVHTHDEQIIEALSKLQNFA